MTEVLGEIAIDDSSGEIVCRPNSIESRKRILSIIKTLVPGIKSYANGGFISLDTKAAISLKASDSSCLLQWSADATAFVDNFASAYKMRGRARQRLLELQDEDLVEKLLQEYQFNRTLDPHQKIAVAAMTDSLIDSMCLFDEQGSGKTVMTIHAFDLMAQNGEYNSMLIFAPKNMLSTWKEDFRKFLGERYKVEIVDGNKKMKLQSLISAADVYVTSYETAHSMENSLRSLILRNRSSMVMAIDESFLVKNAKAARSSAIRRLRNFCRRCWVLCGTPAPNSAIDVVHQFDVADCGVTFDSVVLPKEVESAREMIKSTVEKRGLYLRRLKRDVFPKIPGKNFENIAVPMENTQRSLYEQTLTGLITDVNALGEIEFRKSLQSFLSRRMALFGICSNPKQKFPEYTEVPGKEIALDKLLQELITLRNEKVVLWSYFRASLNELVERYRSYGVVRLDGSVKSAKARQEAIDLFQNDPKTMLFIANPAAAGAGITLTAARIAIYESFPVQTAHFLQSIDRIHRRGQTRDVYYYFLLSQNSIEESEYERLLKKEGLGFELFGNAKPDTITREVFLRELQDALLRLSN